MIKGGIHYYPLHGSLYNGTCNHKNSVIERLANKKISIVLQSKLMFTIRRLAFEQTFNSIKIDITCRRRILVRYSMKISNLRKFCTSEYLNYNNYSDIYSYRTFSNLIFSCYILTIFFSCT